VNQTYKFSSSELPGQLFADGNISSAFKNFGDDHTCNAFCRFYGLTRLFGESQVKPAPPFGASFERMLEEDRISDAAQAKALAAEVAEAEAAAAVEDEVEAAMSKKLSSMSISRVA
jgi:hypothetical protein